MIEQTLYDAAILFFHLVGMVTIIASFYLGTVLILDPMREWISIVLGLLVWFGGCILVSVMFV